MRSTKGISTAGDVLVNETSDGVNLNDVWREIEQALALDNQHRSTIVRLLSYPTFAVADVIPQSVEGESFEVATEFGAPRALREPADYLRLAYDFFGYDKRLGATWKWLRSATAEQVTAQVTRIFEADNRLVSGTILRRLCDPAPRFNGWNYTCYGLWSGDSMVPPSYLGQNFDGSHTHYLTSGSTTLEFAGIEVMLRHVIHHGYGRFGSQGGQLIILAHPDQVEDMTFWRAGVEYATGKTPKWDFVPSAAQPAYFTTAAPRCRTPAGMGDPTDPASSPGGQGLCRAARRPSRRAKAASTEGCARLSNSPPAETSASEPDKSDASQATRRVATPATGFGSRGAFL